MPDDTTIYECQTCGHQCPIGEMDTVMVTQGVDHDAHVYGEDVVLRCRFCGTVDPDLEEVGPDHPVED